LCCGFVRVTEPLVAGTVVHLNEGRRTLKVEIRDEIRPDRTARQSLTRFLP
jgi:aminomethyltransferase